MTSYARPGRAPEDQFRLVVLDPAHFHAALLQKQMYQELCARVSVYAPLGLDLLDYLGRVWQFNSREEDPTRWKLDVHCSSDPVSEMLQDRGGDIVILAGRNHHKIERIRKAISAGLHVLADKPWILSSREMGTLEDALNEAESRGLVAYDVMTERDEPTSELQRVLVNSPEIFGWLEAGSAESPAIVARSVHYIRKLVSGLPLSRPCSFFNCAEQGHGLADVGTHVIDLVQWTAFPEQTIDYRTDIQVLDSRCWPLFLTQEQFKTVTGELFPAALAPNIQGGKLAYHCNNSILYRLRGIYVKLDILWDWQAPENSGDSYTAMFSGTRARIGIRQGPAERYQPELYVIPASAETRAGTFSALRRKIETLQSRWPGLGLIETTEEAQLAIPQEFRVGHEAHFGQVARRFLNYLAGTETMPAWEKPNMLAKYHVSTYGLT